MTDISDFFDKKALALLPASCQVWSVEKLESITLKETCSTSKLKVIRLNSFNSNCRIASNFYKPIDRLFNHKSFKHA